MRNHLRGGGRFIADGRKLEAQTITKGEIDAILRRLQLIDDESKKFGCHMGLVGETGLKVFRYLAYSFAAKGWACFPSYRTIAEQTKLARSTVIEAVARLKRVGALSWEQRRKRHGSRWVQGSNLFRIAMPKWSARLLPILKRVRQKAAAGAAVVADVVKGLSPGSSETGSRSLGATTDLELSTAATKTGEADRKAGLTFGSRRVFSEGCGAGPRLKSALAKLEAAVRLKTAPAAG